MSAHEFQGARERTSVSPSGATEEAASAEPTSATPAMATWFGDAERPLFGWVHTAHVAAGGTANARTCGVVLCNPFGYEAMCAHASLRELAEQLAAAGFPAIRFDYDGTGDSSGRDEDPGRVAAWLASIEQAKSELKARTGVTEVCIFGLRMGALLAVAAAGTTPVDDLVLFGAALSGRTHLRELRAMEAMKARDGVPSSPDTESTGYPLDEEIRADLGKLDAVKATGPIARRALVILRDDIGSGEERLATSLRNRGADVTVSKTPGYAALMQSDPYKCVTPVAVWREIIAWLDAAHPARAHAPSSVIPSVTPSVTSGTTAKIPARDVAVVTASPGASVREEIVAFDDMFGIITEPLAFSPGWEKRPAIVLLNIGANHRVGNNRMYVTFARAWAEAGFRVLRFDLTGIGDSRIIEGSPGQRVYSEKHVPDVVSAMSFLQASRGVKRFGLVGLCSGAYLAFHSAAADTRVSAVVMINVLTFQWHPGDSLEVRTKKTFKSTKFYARAVRDRETWKRLFKGELYLRPVIGFLATKARARVKGMASTVVARIRGTAPGTTEIAKTFRKLAARGTDMLMIFGSDDGGIDVMEEQLGPGAHSMRKIANFRLELIEGTDHTFTPRPSQHTLRERLTLHVIDKFR